MRSARWALLAALLPLVACGRSQPPAPPTTTLPPPPALVPKDLPGDPLDRVRAGVAKAKELGLPPVVVFDLDGTIFDNAARTLWVLPEFAANYTEDPSVSRKIRGLRPDSVTYELDATLDAAGIGDEKVRRAAKSHWRRNFFTDTGVRMDTPLPGAVAYVRELHAAGATIVYLTARREDSMGAGTRDALRAAGFPDPDGAKGVRLILRPSRTEESLDYKREACAELRNMGIVIAQFENEPENANLFARELPDAIHILLDTPHSSDAPAPVAGVVTIPGYAKEAP